MGIDCCFKSPRLADPSLQDEVAQPAGRKYVGIYTQGLTQTNKNRAKYLYNFQTAGGLPSAAPGPSSPQEAHQQLNLLLDLLHLHSTALYLLLLAPPFLPVFSYSLNVPPRHDFMKSLWLLILLYWYWYSSCSLADIFSYSPSKRAASQLLYFSSSLWSPPLCEGQKFTRSTHEGPTLEQGHSEAAWQENEWVTKGSRRALLSASPPPVLPIASQRSAEIVNGWFT